MTAARLAIDTSLSTAVACLRKEIADAPSVPWACDTHFASKLLCSTNSLLYERKGKHCAMITRGECGIARGECVIAFKEYVAFRTRSGKRLE